MAFKRVQNFWIILVVLLHYTRIQYQHYQVV